MITSRLLAVAVALILGASWLLMLAVGAVFPALGMDFGASLLVILGVRMLVLACIGDRK